MSPQQTIAHYRITAKLGEGGMGEVWRATDTKLNREVAVKILPAAFAQDADRMARFQREAQVLAALNHPNIAAIYGVEDRAIVMELVDGPTLGERISQGPIPLADALEIARQIADALEAAHEKGIVHRDLKPANIKVTPEGRVKVLDFGLAKAMAAETAPGDPASSPTLTLRSTQLGVILGTTAYMSPEQAKGKTVDRRADIWAFGVVLAEMLTGRPLYGGETVSDTLAAVLLKEPPLDGLPGDTPSDIRRLLRRCLAKDAQQRLRDIGEARIAIDECLANPGAEEAEVETAPSGKKPGVWIGAALAIALAALALVYFRQNRAELPVLRLTLAPPDGAALGHTFGLVSAFAVSPDGRRVAFVAHSAGGKDQLWVRSLSTFAAQPLAGTEDASYPFWSPDSRFIGFGADGKLKTIDANGGPALTLASAPNLRGGTWNGDVILFAGQTGPLQRVSSAGGVSRPAMQLDASKLERNHRFPWFLPDGHHFLYSALIAGNAPNLRIGDLDSGDTKTLLEADSNAIYASGYLLYLRESNLMAQPFDPKRLVTTGNAVPVAEKVGRIYTLAGAFGIFSASANGVLIYVSGEAGAFSLTWLDRTGKRLGNVGVPGILGRVRISPDGKSAALWAAPGGNQDIWIYDLERGLPRRFTFDSTPEVEAIWSPDGRTLIFNSARKGHFDLYHKNADGTGAEELLYADDMMKGPTSWSPDGRFLLYGAGNPKTLADIWVLPMTQQSGAPAKPYPWLQTQFAESEAVFSPDGQWVAYRSNESGRNEIYVAPFSGPGGKRRVSTAGGTVPRWPAEDNEIFYIGGDSTLMAVPVAARGAALDIGEAHPLFVFPSTGVGVMYDVSAKGRILAILPPQEGGKTANEALQFVQNWSAELKK
jgi:Tol biopolymer transport system component/predicted Ser/Thr protein kinase